MAMIEIRWHPPKKELRNFGLLFLLFFGSLGTYLILAKDVPLAGGIVAGAALTVAALGLLAPASIRPVYLAMMIVAWPIGLVVSTVLLALVYYLLVTPLGLLRRHIGQDTMCRRFDPDKKSYWSPRKPVTDIRRYFRQF